MAASMQTPVKQASAWIATQFLGGSDADLRTAFEEKLQEVLTERYTGHWYPDEPHRGCAYRSMQYFPSTSGIDPLLLQAADAAGVKDAAFRSGPNSETGFLIWVNPGEVKVLSGKIPKNVWIEDNPDRNPYQKLRMKIEHTTLNVEILESPPAPPKPAQARKPIPASTSGGLKAAEASLQPPNGMSSWHPQSLANAPPGMRSDGGSLTPPSMGDSPTDASQNGGLGRASFPPPMMAPLPPQAGAGAPAFSANAAPFNAAAPAFSANAGAFNASAPAFNAAAPAFNVSAAPFNSGGQGMPPQQSIQGGGQGFPPYGSVF